MPVEAGGLRTRCGVIETNRVPRRRWSRIAADRRLGGWAVSASGSSSGFPSAEPLNRPTARLPTACPPTMQADEAAGLVGGSGTAVRTRTWRLSRGVPGFVGRASHTHPNITLHHLTGHHPPPTPIDNNATH